MIQPGLLNYYNSTKENYRWEERALATVYTSNDAITLSRVRNLINNRYNRLLSDEEISFLNLAKVNFI